MFKRAATLTVAATLTALALSACGSTKASSKKLIKLAPIVGSAQGDSIVTLIEGYEKLAESLGANLDDAKVAAGKKEFDTAVANFKKTTAAKKGLTALAVSPTEDLLYVAVPEHAPELLDFQKWGLEVMDDRSYPSNVKLADKQPTWQNIKAAKSGATVPWPAYWLHTYPAYAKQLEALTKALDGADTSIGS